MANDALDFGPSNSSRRFTCSGPATGAGDWCIGFWARDSRIAGSNFDYAVSRGTLGAVNSLQIFVGQAGSGNNGQIGVRARGAAGTEFNETTSTVFTASGNDLLIVVQKRSTAIEIYAVVEDATVSSPLLTSTTNVPGEISAGTWYLGARSDLNTSRFWQNPFGEFFALIGDSLSAAEVETLAAGAHITVVRATRAVDLRFRGNNATESDLSGNGVDATRAGTGYTLVNEFFPDASTTVVTADSELRWNILQAVQKDSTLQWNILSAIQLDLTLDWSVLNAVVADSELHWDLLEVVTQDTDLRYSIIQSIFKDLELRWDADGSISTVLSEISFQWDVVAQIAKSLNVQWDILNSIDADSDFRWNLLQEAAKDLTVRWDVQQAIDAGMTLQWNVIGVVDGDLMLRWSIQSETQVPDIITGTITVNSTTGKVATLSATPVVTVN